MSMLIIIIFNLIYYKLACLKNNKKSILQYIFTTKFMKKLRIQKRNLNNYKSEIYKDKDQDKKIKIILNYLRSHNLSI
jgi:hypothetical protein